MRYEDIPKLATWKNDTSILRTSASGSVLDKIDADIDNYHNAYSAMTRRNLLTDISYGIRKWETMKGTTVSFHTNVVGLKEVIARTMLKLTPSAYKYKQATCLAFNIGCNTPTDEYFRFSDNDAGDMRGKCNEMMHAITHAQSMVTNSGVDNTETLKIFMAPEFYFRGVHGAYSHDLVSQIIPTMQGLGTASGAFKDWLFVFGTAIAASEDEVTYCSTCGVNPNTVRFDRVGAKTTPVCKNNALHPVVTGSWGAEVQNVALIQKGTETHMVVKEYISGIDYAGGQVDVVQGTKKNRFTNTLDTIAPQGSNQSAIASKFQDERMGGGVFTIDGITIGMEICLDHIQSTGPDGRLANYGNTIQILLIPSYGMNITHHPCVQGGIIFNVDGRQNGTSEVVVKGHVAPAITGTANAAAKTGGQIERWGPFAIPRRG